MKSLPEELGGLSGARPIVDYRSQSPDVRGGIFGAENLPAHADAPAARTHGRLYDVEEFAKRGVSWTPRDEHWNRNRVSDSVE